MADRGQGGEVEAHVEGRGGGTDESRGWSVGVGGTTGTGGIIFSDDLVDCGRQINKNIVLEVTGGARKVSVVGLGKLGDPIYSG